MSSTPPANPALHADPITGVKVIYAALRAERRNAFSDDMGVMPEDVQPCPFCAGYETETPPEVFAVRSPESQPNQPGWQLRIVSNRYPALASPLSPWKGKAEGDGASETPAIGYHEIVIETAEHDASWTTMSAEQVAVIFKAIRSRLRQWVHDPAIQSVQVFKNVGLRAGATLVHPHLQIMAMGFSPQSHEFQRSVNHWHSHHQDYWQSLIEAEITRSSRLLLNDGTFTSFCPQVSRVPYEMWILPLRAIFHFHDLSDLELQKLSAHVQQLLRVLEKQFGPTAHNLLWRLAPLHHTPLSSYRWRLEVVPRLINFAGFELSAGIYINPILPEVAAARLRESG
jgi:UDPglucose--hexose-1-phosphate uridylyltransferase